MPQPDKRIVLKKNREKSLLLRHPWVFSGAVKSVEGEVQPGETVDVLAHDGTLLGRGAWSPHSQIRVRMWSFLDETINEAFFRARIRSAISFRKMLFTDGETTAFRLVASESDGLPGVIADRYGDYLILQFLSAGAEYWRKTIIRILQEEWPAKGMFERSDVEVRQKEGLELRTGLLHGTVPQEPIQITENGLSFLVNIREGHKTGFYLDQRDNRTLVGVSCKDKDVLNCFAYTGGFGLTAMKGGARSVLNVDASSSALELSRQNVLANNLDLTRVSHIEGDVFALLRQFREQKKSFDVIALDPPKFVKSKGHLNKAARGYKDINRLALSILRPGGLLFTFSCSGLMSAELFQKIVADAAVEAKRNVRIIEFLGQAKDHPVALNFPEGKYLKGLMCFVE